MRIISGIYKSKRLQAPKNLPVRPTTDMAKEALFNILNHQYYFDAIRVLDLFAGTGNISYEFASRGTQEITSVDGHFGCVRYINKIVKELKMPITTIKSDVFAFLQRNTAKYDIIFADPPYDFSVEQFTQIYDSIFEKELLTENGILIIEHSKHTDISKLANFSYDKKYGGSVFSFFEKE